MVGGVVKVGGRVVAAVGMAVGVVIGVAVTRVLQVFGICHNS